MSYSAEVQDLIDDMIESMQRRRSRPESLMIAMMSLLYSSMEVQCLGEYCLCDEETGELMLMAISNKKGA